MSGTGGSAGERDGAGGGALAGAAEAHALTATRSATPAGRRAIE